LKFECRDFDMMPPSIELLEWDGSPLKHQLRTPKNIFNMGEHPNTKRPFVCMAGAREYHQHESHVEDTWFNYRRRDGFNLSGILYQIWSGWRQGQSQ
jgi:hypothetical protein